MDGNRKKIVPACRLAEHGILDSDAHKIVRERIAFSQVSGLKNDQTEGAGKKRCATAGIGYDIVKFLVRPIPAIKSFGHWT